LNGSLTIGGGSNELSIALPKLQTISGDLNVTWLRESFVATQQGSGWTGSATLAGNPPCP
jgi:hypothetical protein